MTLFGFLALLLLYSAFSRVLARTVLTAPVLFTLAGCALAWGSAGRQGAEAELELFLVVAEVGLVLTLFTDASKTNLSVLRHIRSLPVRLLSTGMLLTIALGTGLAMLVLPGLSVWEAGALAAILAPTDAGLGLVIVNDQRVPVKIRQGLNVEAGLNDGLAVPFLMFFIAMSLAGPGSGDAILARYAMEQLGYGTLIGVAIGLAGGFLLHMAHKRGWMAEAHLRIGAIALPLLCVPAAGLSGASMFIAAFVAGLAVQIRYRRAGEEAVELTEDAGQVLNLAVFFFFGLLVYRAWESFTLPMAIYAVLSLTVVRMLPVWLALLGSGLRLPTALFMGWFGPRGLASIVLGLIYLEHEVHTPGAAAVRLTVMVTVMASIMAHGLTALPGIGLYARQLKKMGPQAPEQSV